MRLKQGKAYVGMVLKDGWKVGKVTAKRVRIFLPSTVDRGYKAGRSFTFSWDGEGFKRQGQYLEVEETS